jgi:hypothetical protein
MKKVPRPSTWLVVLGWAVLGLSRLTDSKTLNLLVFGLFAALTLWWGLWFGQRGSS